MIDEKLAIEILERITKGETFGRETIFDELKATDTYGLLTREYYTETFEGLIKNECIALSTVTPQRGYKINNPKCLELYKRNVESLTTQENVKARIEFLTAENLSLQNRLIGLQIKESKTKIRWAILGGVGAAVLEALVIYGKDILKALSII